MCSNAEERRLSVGTETADAAGLADFSISPTDDYEISPRCNPAACAVANAATADLLARFRVSAASRDVSDAMVSSGLLQRVHDAIGQPVTPEQWITFYEKRADELAVKLDERRRARERRVRHG